MMWLLKRLWLLEAPEKPEGMDVQGVCPGCLLPSLSLWGALSGLPRLGQGAPAPGVLPLSSLEATECSFSSPGASCWLCLPDCRSECIWPTVS